MLDDATRVMAHPWDSEQRRTADFLMFENHYEVVLAKLADFLNKYHGESKSVRYWEIILGPWLTHYGFILFEKFCLLNEVGAHCGEAFELLAPVSRLPIIQDMHEFKDRFHSDAFMFQATADVADLMQLKLRQVASRSSEDGEHLKIKVSRRKLEPVDRLLRIFTRKSDAVIFESFQAPLEDLLWNLMLGQIPRLWNFKRLPSFDGQLDWQSRKTVSTPSLGDDFFQHILMKLAVENIPIAYLEGFSQARKFVDGLRLPSNPRFIFTSNAYFKNEAFKIYSAEKACSGVPILIAQHGGGFGVSQFNHHESHILRVADAFFTWGWTSTGVTTPASVVKPLKGIENRPRGDILLIEYLGPSYVAEKSSIPLGEQGWQWYWEDQLAFYNSLAPEVQSRIRVRLHPGDAGRDLREIWRAAFPNVRFDDISSPLEKSLKTCSFAIVTYDSTTYLQLLQSQFPFVAFWRPDNWKQRSEAQHKFALLAKEGLFYSDPVLAARAVNGFASGEPKLKSKLARVAESPFVKSYAASTPKLQIAVSKWLKSRSLLPRA